MRWKPLLALSYGYSAKWRYDKWLQGETLGITGIEGELVRLLDFFVVSRKRTRYPPPAGGYPLFFFFLSSSVRFFGNILTCYQLKPCYQTLSTLFRYV